MTESFYSKAQDRDVRLLFYTEIPELIMDYDDVRIQQVIYNLLSNALKFTESQGKIVLHASQVQRQDLPVLQLKVTDNGIGSHFLT